MDSNSRTDQLVLHGLAVGALLRKTHLIALPEHRHHHQFVRVRRPEARNEALIRRLPLQRELLRRPLALEVVRDALGADVRPGP